MDIKNSNAGMTINYTSKIQINITCIKCLCRKAMMVNPSPIYIDPVPVTNEIHYNTNSYGYI